MNNVAQTAIARSISHTEIAVIDFAKVSYDSQIMADLTAACDDQAARDDADVVEYWGTTEAGEEWRVHVKGQLGLRAEYDV